MNMSVCYIHNDVDAERCRISLREKSPVTLFTLDSRGRVVWLTGGGNSGRHNSLARLRGAPF
jgi:hypothetical protein